MNCDIQLANRVRDYLAGFPENNIEEKKMFGGLAFMVNGKMCVNVSGERLMCRFDPALEETVAEQKGYEPMIMKGKNYKGYCYVDAIGFKSKKEFEYWLNLSLNFNEHAKSSKWNSTRR